MSKYIGRQIKLGIAKETTRGTIAAPAFWLPIRKADHIDKVEYAFNEAGMGTIMDALDSVITKKMGEGGWSALISDKHIGLVLLSLFGTVTTTPNSPETGVNTHAFTLQEGATHQSLTISIDEPNGDYQFALAMINSLEIKYELGKFLEYVVTFMSKKGATATLTASFTAENLFRPHDLTLKLATTLAGLGAASATKVRSVNLKFEKAVEYDDVLGQVDPNEILNKEFKITGSMEFLFDDEVIKGFALAGTQRALRLQLKNTDVIIGAVTNPEMRIDLAKVAFNDFAKATDLGNLVAVTIGFKGLYSLSDAKFGDVALINTQTSY
jgi:hypothetical protein